MKYLVRFVLYVLVLVPSYCTRAEPSGDGLYAGFITSMGEIWCRLEFERTPRTVANFVSLAEGTRSWIDFAKAQVVNRRYYDGIIFHRVVANFVIQAGSPNGQGTDGPGFQFADEFHASLKHSKPGILSMANSGRNSNGSQFFITVTNTPSLDGVHSIFGEVVEGMSNVYAINKVPLGAGSRPVTPVVIQEVRILRKGAAAEAFNPAQVVPSLPGVESASVGLQLKKMIVDGSETNSMHLLLQPHTNRIFHVFVSDDFAFWAHGSSKQARTNLLVEELLGDSYPTFQRVFFRGLKGGYEP